MRILITGSNGMFGSDLVSALISKYEVVGLGQSQNRHPNLEYHQVNLSDPSQTMKAVEQIQPAIIIHSAAWTDVDGCEKDSYRAFQVNTKGTQYLCDAANKTGAVLFFVSSDYVFDGEKKGAYKEDDQPNPVSMYGRSKLEAEDYLKAHAKSAWIIRTSWLFGEHGKNFFRTMIQLFAQKKELSVVNDQTGAPTYTKNLANGFRQLIEKTSRIKGCQILHLANEGKTTWYDAAVYLKQKTNAEIEIKPVTSDQYVRPAKRPKNSVFDMSLIQQKFGINLPAWNQGLDQFWDECLHKEWEHLKVS